MREPEITGHAECVRCDHPIVAYGERPDGTRVWQHDRRIPRPGAICGRACPPEDESAALVCHPEDAARAQRIVDVWVREGFWDEPPTLRINPQCPRGAAYLTIAPSVEYVLIDYTEAPPDPDTVTATCTITSVEDP